MFEGDSEDTRAEKFPLVSMGGWADGLACADPEARTTIGASENVWSIFSQLQEILRTFRFFQKKTKILPGGGVSPNFFHSKSYFLGESKPHENFQTPTITPSGRKVSRQKREKKTPLIVDT
jgi:hypothetical protein